MKSDEQQPGLARTDYVRFCAALAMTPDPDVLLSPIQRAASLPSWVCAELLATQDSRARLQAWTAAGRPAVNADGIVRRLRFSGSPNTQAVIQNYLLTGQMATPAAWYLLSNVAVLAIGVDARGITMATPSRYERLILLNDCAIDAEGLIGVFLHEAAHAFLLPPPPRNLSDLEDVVLNGPAYWQFAEHQGDTDKLLACAVEDERQACRLATRWGATGPAADGTHCSMGPHFQVMQARARHEDEAGS